MRASSLGGDVQLHNVESVEDKYCVATTVVAKSCHDLKPKVTQTLADSYVVEIKTCMVKPSEQTCFSIFLMQSRILKTLTSCATKSWPNETEMQWTRLTSLSVKSVLLASVEDEQLRLWIGENGQLCSFHPSRVPRIGLR